MLVKKNGWGVAMTGELMDATDRKDIKEWKTRRSPSHWVRIREVRTPAFVS
jgi:hypothetical protein